MVQFTSQSTHVLRTASLCLLAAWTLVIAATPSSGLAWCFESNGSVHIEGVADNQNCAETVLGSGSSNEVAEFHSIEAHDHHRQPHCFECVDVVINGDAVGPTITGSAQLANSLPPFVAVAPVAALVPTALPIYTNAEPIVAHDALGILPRPTVVLLI